MHRQIKKNCVRRRGSKISSFFVSFTLKNKLNEQIWILCLKKIENKNNNIDCIKFTLIYKITHFSLRVKIGQLTVVRKEGFAGLSSYYYCSLLV